MREHRSLWLAGRARCVNHDRDVIRVGLMGSLLNLGQKLVAFGASELKKISKAAVFYTQNLFYPRKATSNARYLIKLLFFVNDYKFRVRMFDDKFALLRRTRRINADPNASRSYCSDITNGPFGQIASEDRNARAFGQTLCTQSAGEIVDFVLKFAPGQRIPTISAPRIKYRLVAVFCRLSAEKAVDIRILHLKNGPSALAGCRTAEE